jgi:hypothetical protein
MYDQLIEEAKNRQFNAEQFDVQQKYLAEQIATAKAAKEAAEGQANLQYQALAQMAAQQQAEALAGTGAGYTEALGQMAEQGGAAAAIGGGTGAALEQQFAAQRIADEQAIREVGAATGGATQSATALQQLLNQAALRDLSMAQTSAETAIASERLKALAAFEQQRQAELQDFRLRRAAEIQRQQEEARRAAAAAAAARAKAAANMPQTPGIDIGTTALGGRLNIAFGSKQVAKDPNTGKPLLDQNKKPIMQEWGSFIIEKTVKGQPETVSVNTAAMAGDVRNLGLQVNYIMTDQTGNYKDYTQQQRINEATALVDNTKKSLTEVYGGNAVYDAWKAPVNQGGLGLPASADGFIRLTVGK